MTITDHSTWAKKMTEPHFGSIVLATDGLYKGAMFRVYKVIGQAVYATTWPEDDGSEYVLAFCQVAVQARD
mgnify:CR=1 FL=1